MKTPTLALLIAVILTASAIVVVSQDGKLSVPQLASSKAERFDLNFSGGHPAELVKALEKASGKPLNALIPETMSRIALPELLLQKVSVETVMKSLSIHQAQLGVWSQEDNVWILQPAPALRQARTFYIGHLLARFKVESIVGVIQQTWRLESGDRYTSGGESGHNDRITQWRLGAETDPHRAELAYNEETQILIATANDSQIAAFADLIEQLSLAINTPVHQPNSPSASK